jgi:BCD family chlorophyll transporter-like MFS transporter
MKQNQIGWLGVAQLGLVQVALGAIVVLTTSTINRVMVVELALPAMLPGALVALHYALQILRPRVGHGSDRTMRRKPWIIGGLIVLALGGILSAVATALMSINVYAGVALAVVAFIAIGVGVSAAGTALLVLLTKLTPPPRRPAAATIVWLMMIAGFATTAILAGKFLDPFSFNRLIIVTTVVCLAALALALLALSNIDDSAPDVAEHSAAHRDRRFSDALRSTWSDPKARLFTIFIFLSMLAYSTQDPILEPFAGLVFGYTPGQSTALSGLHHSGVFAGMVFVGICATALSGRALGSLRIWIVTGCLASAVAICGIIVAALAGSTASIRYCVFALGLANGVFAIAAIGQMMSLAGEGGGGREGIRMGLWGAAQGIAFGLGSLAGAIAIDIARYFVPDNALAYSIVFSIEGFLFLVAAALAYRLDGRSFWPGASLTRLGLPVGAASTLAVRPLQRGAVNE